LNQVPMVFHWPNNPEIRKGAMVDQQVQNLDIMPTILALSGIQGPTNMQGRSLIPLLNGSGTAKWEEQPAITQAMVSPRDSGPPGGGGDRTNNVEKPHFGIIDHGWKLIRKEIGPDVEELYEHTSDYLNLTNVIKADASPARVKTLAATLDTWKTRAKAAQLPSDDTMTQQLSSEELRRLRALGYVGGGTTPRPATNAPPTNAPSTNTRTNTGGNSLSNIVRKTNAAGVAPDPDDDHR